MPMPKKPDNILDMTGSRQPRTGGAPVGDLLHEAPPPPYWLKNGHAKAEWERLTGILASNKLLSEAGLTTLAHMCSIHGTILTKMAGGEEVTAHLYSQYTKLATEFGLTVLSGAKVTANRAPDKPRNKFTK